MRKIFAGLAIFAAAFARDAAAGPSTESLLARAAIHGLDLDTARALLAKTDAGDAAAGLERARLAIYEGDCDKAVTILSDPQVAKLDEEVGLGEIASGCARVTAATSVYEDKAANVYIRFQDDADQVLVPLLVETITKARDTLTRDFGVDWPKPTRVVVVRDLVALSAMTGLPYKDASTTGTVGIAKWGRVTLLSPRASQHGFAWRDTLAHELTHLAVTRASGDLAPLWLQEGLAKREEIRWRGPGPFDDRPSPESVVAYGMQKHLDLPLDTPPPNPINASYARAMSLCYTLVVQNAPDKEIAKRLTAEIERLAALPDQDALIQARLAVARAFGAVIRRSPTAAALFDLAARTMEKVGNAEIARMQRNSLGTALGWLGRWEEAAEMLRAIPEAGGRAWLWTRVTLAWSIAQLGELDEAIALLDRVVAAGGNDFFLIIESRIVRARVEIMRGRTREALSEVESALADETLPKAIVARLHAVAWEAARDPKHGRALEDLLAQDVVLVEDAVYVRQIAAEAALQSGDRERARTHLAQARTLVDAYAAQITAPDERDRFLERVRENARVIALGDKI